MLIALLTIVVALPLGHWYIVHHVTYDGDMHTVHTIFNVSIIAAAMSFIGVPYNGLLIARERFFVFCLTDVAMSLFKLFFTYLLIDHFEHKLIIYTCVMAFMTAYGGVLCLLPQAVCSHHAFCLCAPVAQIL